MEKEKFSFDFEIIKILRVYTDKFKQQGLNTDLSYLDYYGDQCPKCGNKMKSYQNTVKGLGSISAFMILEQNKAVLYPLCKPCAKKMIGAYYSPHDDKRVEEYIAEKLPQLKRCILNETMKTEEIKKENEIIDKLME